MEVVAAWGCSPRRGWTEEAVDLVDKDEEGREARFGLWGRRWG